MGVETRVRYDDNTVRSLVPGRGFVVGNRPRLVSYYDPTVTMKYQNNSVNNLPNLVWPQQLPGSVDFGQEMTHVIENLPRGQWMPYWWFYKQE
jgi:hypothetical protein